MAKFQVASVDVEGDYTRLLPPLNGTNTSLGFRPGNAVQLIRYTMNRFHGASTKLDACSVTLQKLKFSELHRGQVFLSQQGIMYRKVGDRSADLIRLPSGAEPEVETVDELPLDEVVELVPTRDESESG